MNKKISTFLLLATIGSQSSLYTARSQNSDKQLAMSPTTKQSILDTLEESNAAIANFDNKQTKFKSAVTKQFQDAASSINLLDQEIKALSSKINTSERNVKGELNEATSDITTKLSNLKLIMNNNAKLISKASTSYNDKLETEVDRVVRKVESTGNETKTNLDQISNDIGEISGNTHGLINKSDSIERMITTRFDDLNTEIQTIKTLIINLGRTTDGIANKNNNINNIIASHNEALKLLPEIASGNRVIREKLADFSKEKGSSEVEVNRIRQKSYIVGYWGLTAIKDVFMDGIKNGSNNVMTKLIGYQENSFAQYKAKTGTSDPQVVLKVQNDKKLNAIMTDAINDNFQKIVTGQDESTIEFLRMKNQYEGTITAINGLTKAIRSQTSTTNYYNTNVNSLHSAIEKTEKKANLRFFGGVASIGIILLGCTSFLYTVASKNNEQSKQSS